MVKIVSFGTGLAMKVLLARNEPKIGKVLDVTWKDGRRMDDRKFVNSVKRFVAVLDDEQTKVMDLMR